MGVGVGRSLVVEEVLREVGCSQDETPVLLLYQYG